MRAILRSCGQAIREHRVVTIIIALVIVFALIIWAGYWVKWDVIGFITPPQKTVATEITRSPQEKVTTTVGYRTLWDCLQLLGVLAIPIVVGFGTLFFTRQQAKTSEANAENQQQEELLRTYFDKISALLLNKELSTSSNIQSIVRARTLAALSILNAERKTIVLRFLHDTDLLQYVKSSLYSRDLNNTDLNRIDLSGAYLQGANLSGANLSGANLNATDLGGANLNRAKLTGAIMRTTILNRADLSGADLRYAVLPAALLRKAILFKADLLGAMLIEADLNNANLTGANLRKADLTIAKLHGANLRKVDLSDADLKGADLSDADLKGANLDGTIATPEQLTKAKNVTPKQRAQSKSPQPIVIPKAAAAQTSTTLEAPVQSGTKPDQTSQEAEQQEHTHPKRDTDTTSDRADGSIHP